MSGQAMSPIELSVVRRINRQAQKKWREARKRQKLSLKTELENAQIMLAWECGLLSEGQVCAALGLGQIEARTLRDSTMTAGQEIGSALWLMNREKRTGR